MKIKTMYRFAMSLLILGAFLFDFIGAAGLGSLAIVTLTAEQQKEKDEVQAFIKEQAEAAATEKAKAIEERYLKEIELIKQANQGKIDDLQKAHDKLSDIVKQAEAGNPSNRIKALGDLILEGMDKHKEAIAAFAKGGSNNFSFGMETKAVITVAKPTNSVAPDFAPIVGIPHEDVHARNVIPVSQTSSDNIRYVQFTAKEGAIGMVAQGGAKPAFDWTVTVKDAPVRKIAGNVTVTTEFLDDIVGASSFLASELPQAYLDVEDFQVFKGDGTGQNLTGLFTIATPLTYSGTVTIASNRWDKLALAVAKVRRLKRSASAVFISPEDFMELLINKTSTGEYTYPAIYGQAPLTIAGLPIYQHSVIDAGEALVGDYARGVRIFERQAPVVKFAYEHASNFTSNLVTVQVEGRIALPIYYPESFISVDFATA